MIRSLRPGRLLRPGRGLRLPRSCPISYHALPHGQSRHLKNARNLSNDEFDFLLSYAKLPKSPLSGPDRKDPDAWIPHLVNCLQPKRKGEQPVDLSRSGDKSAVSLFEHTDDLNRAQTLRSYLWLSKNNCGVDALVHLGFSKNQWSSVHAMLNELIDAYEVLAPYIGPKNPLPGFNWATKKAPSLDDLTDKRQFHGTEIPIQHSFCKLDLNVLTSGQGAEILGERLLATVFLNLGTLVLAAADSSSNPEQSKLAMSCVFRILARLHHLGLISDKVYQYPTADPSQLSFRPPGLHLLSSHIMTVLSDAAWREHEATLANTANEAGEDPPFLPFNVGFRELGPEIWLELILWCCVENGFPREGAVLVGDMNNSKRVNNEAWCIKSWAPLVQALDTVRQTNVSTEASWRNPGNNDPPRRFNGVKKPPFNGLGERTISREVVVSIRDSLSNHSYVSIGSTGLSALELLNLTAPLNQLLESAGPSDELRPTNRITNWHFQRMLESGGFSVEDDPVSFEKLLRTTKNLVPPWEEPIPTDQRLDKLTRAQIYDETFAISGLIQHAIRSHVRKGQSGQALHAYAWLQNIVDASKVHHISHFFESLKEDDTKDVSFFDSGQLGSSLDQKSLPQMSNLVLGELLDMVTTIRAFDFGNWLLFNDDVDGPSIPPASYGDQVIAPSILRFAAATQNKSLSDQVIASLASPVTANTLKALVNLHISNESWDRVIRTLEFMRDFRANSWGFSNITALGAKIIRLDAIIQRKRGSGFQSATEEIASLEKSKDIFLRIFAGEFSIASSKGLRVAEFQKLALKRMAGMFKALPGPLFALLKQAELATGARGRDKIIHIPTNSFHDLLSAVIDSRGSVAGKRLFDDWCVSRPSPTELRRRDGGNTRLLTGDERDLDKGDPEHDFEWNEYVKSKPTTPNLNTIRLIAQAAYREFQLESSLNITPRRSETRSLLQPQSSPTPSLLSPTQTTVGKKTHTYRPISRPGAIPPSSEIEAVLDFCVDKFLRAGLGEEQIEQEIPGHWARMRERNLLEQVPRLNRKQVKLAQDPWMDVTVNEGDKNKQQKRSGYRKSRHPRTDAVEAKFSQKHRFQPTALKAEGLV
ncbi:hypothetical protein N7532_004555 [Penicillium argentinense]|uniref:Uncharacterized protein n=1 Tax=Penicillium argentinense TaxID=1131581 RepID=A0A9W9KFN1_9EURO|nr:uncharacterized protein N7532_004555 [Penicillium argentinense]KAJ5104026.1 hypothetical protein N7532_004555 [Penicillium argentinense]